MLSEIDHILDEAALTDTQKIYIRSALIEALKQRIFTIKVSYVEDMNVTELSNCPDKITELVYEQMEVQLLKHVLELVRNNRKALTDIKDVKGQDGVDIPGLRQIVLSLSLFRNQ